MINTSRILFTACFAAGLVFASGCRYLRQDMADQPKNKALSPSDFFNDGRSERPLIENTVAHGSIANDDYFVAKDSNSFPSVIPVNEELLERGQERYKIFCSPCHGMQGDGDGMVAMRGMKHPPTYHQDRLRNSPNGYYYDVITNGFGQMMGYSAQVPPRDRWAIISYIRALQLSRNAHGTDISPEMREKMNHPNPSGVTEEKKGESGSMKDSAGGSN